MKLRGWHEHFVFQEYTRWATAIGYRLIWWREESGVLGCAFDDCHGLMEHALRTGASHKDGLRGLLN